jgi:hypothetical protein
MILKVKEKVKSNFSKYLKAYLKRLCKYINNILSEVQDVLYFSKLSSNYSASRFMWLLTTGNFFKLNNTKIVQKFVWTGGICIKFNVKTNVLNKLMKQ